MLHEKGTRVMAPNPYEEDSRMEQGVITDVLSIMYVIKFDSSTHEAFVFKAERVEALK